MFHSNDERRCLFGKLNSKHTHTHVCDKWCHRILTHNDVHQRVICARHFFFPLVMLPLVAFQIGMKYTQNICMNRSRQSYNHLNIIIKWFSVKQNDENQKSKEKKFTKRYVHCTVHLELSTSFGYA